MSPIGTDRARGAGQGATALLRTSDLMLPGDGEDLVPVDARIARRSRRMIVARLRHQGTFGARDDGLRGAQRRIAAGVRPSGPNSL
jgi:hypothetical protein